MPKGKSKTGTRTFKEVTCKICGFKGKTNGIAEHFKFTHGLTGEQYREKFGEYRPKYLDYKKRTNDKFTCKICNKEHSSDRHLSFHVKKEHNITKEDYVLKHIFNNEHPTCECGCGDEVKIKGHYPYKSEYISGHNVFMHIGMTRSKESRMKMRESAIKRIENQLGVFFKNGVSNAELELREFISSIYSDKIIHNDKTVLHGNELDIYLPNSNLSIELNGEYFHSDLKKPKRYHVNKTKECNDKGIHLIHIWLSDWIKRKEIVKSIISTKLGKCNNRLFARKTEIRELTHKESSEFLMKYHLQGSSVSSIRLGLFHDGELVQVMTFGKLRRATGRKDKVGSYELLRMCSKPNTIIVGGANKLLKHFIKTNSPKQIISYANRDWATGLVYEKMGFEFVKFTEIGYFYHKSKNKYHRYQFQKHKLVNEGYDKEKTEYEIMLERGFDKVWDTGNFLFQLNL